MNREKYLPIGSVVLLKNGKKRVMITGFAAITPEKTDKIFDYMGCLYPEGIISSDKNLLFDHEQIDQIYYMGYSDDEWKKAEVKIKETLEKRLSMPINESKNQQEKITTQTEQKIEKNIFEIDTGDLFN